VEELYFRGFLLPRMPEKLKGWSPLANSFLFAIYHTWSPWMIVTRTIALLPLIYVVQRKRNIYVGMIAHCLANLIDVIMMIAFIGGLS
jgi:membrane protease YdiL (CAAX protease family)